MRIASSNTLTMDQTFAQILSSLHCSPLFGWVVSGILAAICGVAVLGILIIVVKKIPNKRSNPINQVSDHTILTDATRIDWIRRALIVLCMGVIFLGPSVTRTSTTQAVKNTDILIAVDTTGSMAVHDAQYGSDQQLTRLQVAQQVVKDSVSQFPNASYAAIRVGTSGSVALPLTPDALAIANWSSTLRPEPTAASHGSNLDKALDALIPLARDTRKAHPQDTIVVLYITDGEQTDTTTRRSFASLRQSVDHALVIGVGSAKGGTVPTVDTDGVIDDQHPVTDPSTGQPGISARNEKNLSDIADEMSGSMCLTDSTHTCMSAQDTSLQHTFTSWRIEHSNKPVEQEELLVWPFVIIMLLLLVWEAGVWTYRSRRAL